VKLREFPRHLNQLTRQAKGFDSEDKSRVCVSNGQNESEGGSGSNSQSRGRGEVVVEANSLTGGEPCPLFSSILGPTPL
jgi:hypothetical protein